MPGKYFFFNHAVDPLFNSFVINKIISALSRGGDKKRARRVLYEWMRREKDFLSPDLLYYLVEYLRPTHLNVIARRGRDVYRAPIPASFTKSIMKGVRFFKNSVRARRYDKNFSLKLWNELNEFYT